MTRGAGETSAHSLCGRASVIISVLGRLMPREPSSRKPIIEAIGTATKRLTGKARRPSGGRGTGPWPTCPDYDNYYASENVHPCENVRVIVGVMQGRGTFATSVRSRYSTVSLCRRVLLWNMEHFLFSFHASLQSGRLPPATDKVMSLNRRCLKPIATQLLFLLLSSSSWCRVCVFGFSKFVAPPGYLI